LLVAYALAEEARLNAPYEPPPPEPPQTECKGEEPRAADPQRFDSPPSLTLEPGVDYRAVIATTCGDIEMDLLENEFPQAVANFVFLARKSFYDGLRWHRVERNFIIQTGDPNNRVDELPDGPGYSIPTRPPAKANEYSYGVVAFAHEGPDGYDASQFFIIVHDSPLIDDPKHARVNEPAGLQKLYTPFAEVDKDSYEVIDTIATEDVRGGNIAAEAPMPQVPIYVTSIEIAER
jgi:cyclophilin family peptidyl-prolyl cis-trans isomerase